MSKSNEHFQGFYILELHVYHFHFKKAIFVLSWLDEKPEKNYKDSDLTLLLNGDETFNSSWCFLQHISVGTCPLHTYIAGRPSALAGHVEVNPYVSPFSPTKSASGSCTSKSYGSSMHAVFLGFVVLSVFLDIK